jgi:translation initiation factor SUI1
LLISERLMNSLSMVTSTSESSNGYSKLTKNGRKTLTTVQGLPKELDAKKLLKSFKKEFACNGTIVKDEELGTSG